MAAKMFAVVLVAMAASVLADESTDQRAAYMARFKSAKQLVNEGNYVEAIKAFNAMAESTRVPAVQIELGRCFKALGETEMAIAAYSMVIVAPGVEPEKMLTARVERANLYLASSRFREAVEDFTQAIQLDPTNADLHYGRGIALLSWVRSSPTPDEGTIPTIEYAIKSFDSAIRFDDNYALAYYERGMAKLMLGREPVAQMDLSRALSIAPGELAVRLVELTTQQQIQINELRSKLASQELGEQAEVNRTPETTELLREIRDLLREQNNTLRNRLTSLQINGNRVLASSTLNLPKTNAKADKDIHVRTQVALLKSPFLIASAMRHGDLRELPLLHNKENPAEWIASHLDVVAVGDEAKITMSAEEGDAGSLKFVVDAIADAYQREILGQQER